MIEDHCNIVEYKDALSQANALATIVCEGLTQALESKETASLAVAGGTTPKLFLQTLAEMALDWSSIWVTLTDERCVASSHPRSNAKMVQTAMAKAFDNGLTPLFFMLSHSPDKSHAHEINQALANYERRILPHMPLNVCVLGMGTDAHIASLFPNAETLIEATAESTSALALPVRAPGADEPRITLTANALMTAHHRHLLIQGEEKLKCFQDAINHPSIPQKPVSVLLQPWRGVQKPLTVHYCP